MSPLSLNSKLRGWLGSSRLAVPALMTVTSCGLLAPRPRRLSALAVCPTLLGLASLGVLGWRASQVRKPPEKALAPPRARTCFAFTWQMSEEISASAASGH